MASSSRLRACVAGFVAQTSAGRTLAASAVRSGIPSLLSARPGAHSFRFVSLLEHPVEFAKVLLCSALKGREVGRILFGMISRPAIVYFDGFQSGGLMRSLVVFLMLSLVACA